MNLARFASFVVVCVVVLPATTTRAQDRFEAGAQVAIARSGEFEATDTGFGGRLAWRALDFLAAEAEMNVYPRTFPASRRTSFSSGRLEGLFGVTAGPRFARVRPFAKLRPGFVRFRGHTIACILIFPPPLACQLAAGRTVFALDVGGGVELSAGPRTFVRIDAGDRVLTYPGPSFRNGRVTQQSFFSHDLRLSAGAGLRF
jgi:hypothetical protein